MIYVKTAFKYFLRALLIFFGFIGAYLLFAFLFTLIPVNTAYKQPQEGVEIFVQSNGVHCDLILPVKTPYIDWKNRIYVSDFKPQQKFEYISFGWGNRAFYMEIPTWADLTFKIAFKALFTPSKTAMHVTYLNKEPGLNDYTRKVKLSTQQYIKLVNYIHDSFDKDEGSRYKLIGCCNYAGMNDNFYEATGSYHLFKTCNVWTNTALQKAGVKTALWAPFEKSVLYHLDKGRPILN